MYGKKNIYIMLSEVQHSIGFDLSPPSGCAWFIEFGSLRSM